MIRKSVQDLVDLCRHVTVRDEAIALGQPGTSVDSFRKLKWKRRREAQRLGLPEKPKFEPKASEEASVVPDEANTNAEGKDGEQTECNNATDDEDNDAHPVLRFEEFLDDFIASEVDVSNVRRLPARSSDPLGVISTPTRREGYSFTLARFDSTELLVVFGGRQLRDMTNVLPVASSVLDPLKLERVRYAFSNGVYSYDCHSTLWTLHQCTGRYPKARSDHSAVFVAPHFLVLFGGRGRSGMLFNDLFVLSLKDWQWTELDTPSRPSARYWHSSCVTGDQLYIFGGRSEVDMFGDLQQFPIERGVQALLRLKDKHDEGKANSTDDTSPRQTDNVFVPLAWTAPHAVGKMPSPRFGLRMVPIDHDRIAFVGGWRVEKRQPSKPKKAVPRSVDVYILDTTTMVWTKPRFSSHICRLSAPPARFHFECFYTQRCIVVYGGFTYQHNGETESYGGLLDEKHIIYKLDLHRMIWRRQMIQADEAALLQTQYPHFSSNATVRRVDDSVAYSCSSTGEELHLHLTALTLHAAKRKAHLHQKST